MLFHLKICGELQEGVSPGKQTLFEGKMREQRAKRQLDCCLLHPVKHQYPAKVFDLYLNVHRGVK